MPEGYQEVLMHNLTYLRRRTGCPSGRWLPCWASGRGAIRKIEQGIWPPNLPVSVLILAAHCFGVRFHVMLFRRLDEEGAPPTRLKQP